MNRRPITATVCAAVLLASAPAVAGPSMNAIFRAALSVRDLGDVSISPDGSAIAWRETFNDLQGANETRRRMALFVKREGGPVERLSAGAASSYYDEENPVWSPDGKRIAFLSDARSTGQEQIYVADSRGKSVRRVGNLKGAVQDLRWLPNERAVSILYIENARRSAGALAPGARDVGVVGSQVDEQRLEVVALDTGAATPVTPSSDYVYEYDWSPDSTAAAITYAKGNGDNNWWIAKLATVAAKGGVPNDLFAPAYQLNDPRWAPDGKRVAFIGGIMSDFGSVGGDVYVVDVASHAVTDIVPHMAVSASSIQWIHDHGIFMTAHDNGALHLVGIDTSTGALSTLVGGPTTLRSVSISKNGSTVALVRSSFSDAPEIWAGPPSALRPVTNVNAGAAKMAVRAQSLNWKSDAFNVQGWLVYPAGYDPSKKYPMITVVHGGPSAESLPSFGNRTIEALASSGYFVFEPNPRGSYGQGEAFTAANVKDFGYGDWRDDLAGIDTAIHSASIDPNRLGLWGWSYGGYMAMWAETQTNRFKAIVAGAGVVNWQSYYGQNKIDQWMIPFFGASVYDDPAIYAKSSPITFIKQSKTPVLILQGERDEEVPAPQSFEFWHAMQTLGVPTKLVVYADEGHSPRRPANQVDILQQTLNWYSKYL